MLSIADQQELLNRLVAQMGQGGTSGNFINGHGGLEPPKQSDIAAFKAAAHPSAFQQSGDGDGLPAALIDNVGNSRATAALPEIYGAGNTQQSDRLGQNMQYAAQHSGRDEVTEAEKKTAGALDDAAIAKMEKDKKKQDAISALMNLIQSFQQQLQIIDTNIGTAKADLATGMSMPADIGRLKAKRSQLVSQIQRLQQQLQVLLSS